MARVKQFERMDINKFMVVKCFLGATMQVSIFSMIFMAVSAVVSIGVPIGLFIVFYKKYDAKFLPLFFGVAGFIVFVLLLERAVHLIVLDRFSLREKPFLYILYGVFMAGIFEETARFISFNILKKKYTGIGTGLSYGIGHGGIESILLAGLAMVNSLVVCILFNTGNFEIITNKLQGDAIVQLNNQMNTLLTTAPYMFLVSCIERIFAIGIQISLTILVYYSVYGKNKLWLYPLAILLHAIIDVPAAAMQVNLLKSWVLVEMLVGISAVLAIILARYIHKKLKE